MGKHLNPMNLDQLLDSTFQTNQPLIEGLLYSGTYLLVGSPKIGKSFFVTQLGYHVASGTNIWGLEVRKKKVLYLSLEDTFARLQKRYTQMFGLDTEKLGTDFIFATESDFVGNGLIQDLENFIRAKTNIGLVIIDTLQKVRPMSDSIASYSTDYCVLSSFKYLSDKYGICVILVHHTRKLEAQDAFDTISGTNGLLGAADGALVINKNKRIENKATIHVVGRDQPDMQIAVEFNRNTLKWELSQDLLCSNMEKTDPIIELIDNFLEDSWSGTASQLLEALKIEDVKANMFTRKLNVLASTLLNSRNISYIRKHRTDRLIFLKRVVNYEIDDNDDSDDV